MAINKVNYGNQTLIDTSNDTADASDVKAGETFHSKTGTQLTGTMVLNPVPAGVIQLYGGEYAPPNWLFCDGSAVSRTDYAALYSAIGTVYGAGDGSTTFNLPDFRGRGPLGTGLGNAGGATNHILGEYGGDERLQEHSHSHISSNSNQNVIGGGSAGTIGKAGASGSQYSYKSFSIGNTGEGQSGNMSPYIGINFIISTGLDLPWNSGTTELPIVRGVLVNGQNVVDNGIAEIPTGTVIDGEMRSASVSVPADGYTWVCSIDLPAGVWSLSCGVRFPANSTGWRQLCISDNSASASPDTLMLVPASGSSSVATFLNGNTILTPTSDTTYYMILRHSGSASLNITTNTYMKAVRIA